VQESWTTSYTGEGVAVGLDLLLAVDPANGRRAGLEHALRAAVRDGRLPPGTRLPSSRTLAVELGLARGTVTAAYEQLVSEGHLVSRTGSSTRVAGRVRPGPVDLPAELGGGLPLDLRPGTPDVTTFPTMVWLRATRRALATAPYTVHGYGDPRGRVELRTALSDYLARTRGVVSRPEQIVVTTGYQQELGLLAVVARARGLRTVAMEDPGLDFHREVVARAGLRVVALPVDAVGARSDQLTTARYRSVGAVVVTPAHQYPTGVPMRPGRRRALAEWAVATGGLVVEDDYDGEFRYDRQPVGALQGMAPEHVVYVGSASKTLGPGVRLGWAVLPPPLVEEVVEAKRHLDGQTASVAQLALADLLATHAYDRHVRACRQRYRRRREHLVEQLRAADAGRGRLELPGIAAGLQTLVPLPDRSPREADLLEAAAARGLALTGLRGHWHRPSGRPEGLVVGFAAPPSHRFAEAVAVLADLLA